MNELDKKIAKDIFDKTGAVLTDGHFVYTGGEHGSAYVQKDRIYPDTADISTLCRMIAQEAHKKGIDIDTVVGPATGAIILSQWTTHHLRLLRPDGKCVKSVYAEKDAKPDSKAFVFGREYDIHVTGKNVFVVEDIINSGGSVTAVVEAIQTIGGTVVGVGALCNRGGVTAERIGLSPDVPLFSLLDFTFERFKEAECPLCTAGIPINTNAGKGKEYLVLKAGDAKK